MMLPRMLLLLSLSALALAQVAPTTYNFCSSNPCVNGECFNELSLCVCFNGYSGRYCDISTCQTVQGQCLDIIEPVIQAPPSVELSCSDTDLSPTPSGTGAPFLFDNCGNTSLSLSVTNQVSRRVGRESCPNAFTILRTFNVSDQCGNFATAQQRIFIDDFQPPSVTVRLVPLPGFSAQYISANSQFFTSNAFFGDKMNMNGATTSTLTQQLRPFSSDNMFTTTSVSRSIQQNTVSSAPQSLPVCNPPSVRNFLVVCNVSDNCSPTANINVQARLRVVRITNTNQFVSSSNFPVSTNFGKPGLGSGLLKPFSTSNGGQSSSNGVGSNSYNNIDWTTGNINNRVTDSNQVVNTPTGNSADFTGILSNNFNNVNLGGSNYGGNNYGNTNNNNDLMTRLNNMMNGGNNIGGSMMGSNNNMMSNMMNTGSVMNNNNLVNNMMNMMNNDLLNSAIQCTTTVDYVPVSCGDVVQIELQREDACLADDFLSSTSPVYKMMPLSMDSFDGGMTAMNDFLNANSLQQFSSSFTRTSALSVRGTAVSVQVRAQDECGNMAQAFSSTSDSCDSIISGRCCPSISPVSRVVRQSVSIGSGLGSAPFNDFGASPLQKLRQMMGN